MSKPTSIPAAVSAYMAQIGARGGKASAGTEAAKIRSAKAHAARWGKAKPESVTPAEESNRPTTPQVP